ncbi:MAG: hypothetical protein JXB26_02080 [Candidatus Aminicenantes bacterium]|nr:hypothetical protein [Candidatus Aminicenantes bacterium]
MKKIWTPFILVLILGIGIEPLAQFTAEEVAEFAKWEDFLATAEIVEQEQMGGRLAVTEPWKLTLEKDGIRRNALWKDVQGRQKGYLENWRWEIAAYRLSNYLGLNMVAPTVERRFQGNRGSIQLWVDSEMSYRDKIENDVKTPSYKVFYFNRAVYLQRAFDNLIANEDRHMGNILITKDWRFILIDHSRTFRTSGKFTKNLINTSKSREGNKEMKQLPRDFVDKIKELTAEKLKEIVGEYLDDKEIEAVMKRKVLILEEIDKIIKRDGEDKVLY